MLEAEDELTIKVGKATLVMKKNGDITMNGKKITIKGDGDVVVKGSKIAQNWGAHGQHCIRKIGPGA